MLLALASCRTVGTRVHNLEELHSETGRHQRKGALMGDAEYLFRNGLVSMLKGTAKVAEAPDRAIDDPLKSCVRNLALLADFDAKNFRTRALQVQWYARLASEDPWKLSRELAVRELGPLGRALGVEFDDGTVPGDPTATADDARAALARLIAATRPLLAPRGLIPRLGSLGRVLGGANRGAPPQELVEACATIDGLPLELQGALRLLRGAALLEAAGDAGDARLAPLRATIDGLERRCIHGALLAALTDRPPTERVGSHPGWNSPLVRAAAARSAVQVFGDQVLANYLARLDGQPDEVLMAVLQLIGEQGLPHPDGIPDEEWPKVRASWIEAVLRQGTDHPDGRVRVQALSALARIRGDGSAGFNEKDWYAWWRDEVAPVLQQPPAEAADDTAPQDPDPATP